MSLERAVLDRLLRIGAAHELTQAQADREPRYRPLGQAPDLRGRGPLDYRCVIKCETGELMYRRLI